MPLPPSKALDLIEEEFKPVFATLPRKSQQVTWIDYLVWRPQQLINTHIQYIFYIFYICYIFYILYIYWPAVKIVK